MNQSTPHVFTYVSLDHQTCLACSGHSNHWKICCYQPYSNLHNFFGRQGVEWVVQTLLKNIMALVTSPVIEQTVIRPWNKQFTKVGGFPLFLSISPFFSKRSHTEGLSDISFPHQMLNHTFAASPISLRVPQARAAGQTGEQPVHSYSNSHNNSLTLREVILKKKAASFWTLSKSGLDPPPPLVLDTFEVTFV